MVYSKLRMKKAAAALVLGVIARRRLRRARRKECSCWISKFIARRTEKRIYNALMTELRIENEKLYQNFLRMDEATFDYLAEEIKYYDTEPSEARCEFF